jgi:hypothetical protein
VKQTVWGFIAVDVRSLLPPANPIVRNKKPHVPRRRKVVRLRYPYFRCGNGAADSQTIIEKAAGVNDRVPDGRDSPHTSFTAGAGAHVDAPPSRTRGGGFENRAYAETPIEPFTAEAMGPRHPSKRLKDAPSRKREVLTRPGRPSPRACRNCGQLRSSYESITVAATMPIVTRFSMACFRKKL